MGQQCLQTLGHTCVAVAVGRGVSVAVITGVTVRVRGTIRKSHVGLGHGHHTHAVSGPVRLTWIGRIYNSGHRNPQQSSYNTTDNMVFAHVH